MNRLRGILSSKPRCFNVCIPNKHILAPLGRLMRSPTFTKTLKWDLHKHIDSFFEEVQQDDENDLDDNEIFMMKKIARPIIAEYLYYEPYMPIIQPQTECWHITYDFDTQYILCRDWYFRSERYNNYHPSQYFMQEKSIAKEVQKYGGFDIHVTLLNSHCDPRKTQDCKWEVGYISSFTGSSSKYDVIAKANIRKIGIKRAALAIKSDNILALRSKDDGNIAKVPNGAILHYVEVSHSGVKEYRFDPNSTQQFEQSLVDCKNQSESDQCKHIILRCKDKHNGNIGTKFFVNGDHTSSKDSQEFDTAASQTDLNLFVGAPACRCRAVMPPTGALFKIEMKQY